MPDVTANQRPAVTMGAANQLGLEQAGAMAGDVDYMAIWSQMSLDIPTSASVDDRESYHRPRSVGFVRIPDEP